MEATLMMVSRLEAEFLGSGGAGVAVPEGLESSRLTPPEKHFAAVLWSKTRYVVIIDT